MEKMPQLSVIIPAYNEEKRLGKTLSGLSDYFHACGMDAEVIVVDDGSVDGTRRLAEEKCAKYPWLKVIGYTENRGKGHAVRTGIALAEGEVLLFFDADASTPIEEIQKVLPLIEKGADVVIGSRSLPNSDVRVHQPWYRETMGRVFNLFVHWIVLDGFVDTQCGFKAFRRKAAREIFALQRMSGFSFDVELLVIAGILGYTVREAPVVWVNSPMSRVHPVWDSIKMLVELMKIRSNRIMGRYGRKGL
jgi:dolichyl-phosphate beta-glucosyltransferase